ncbi:hypothetical protein [Geoalkalibacter subterraneus]|uniref:hypothetical protein n=1 Tax=Geoalkalibacter subterraneus TaxID=483547 RepID=UPI001184FF63|nr:hypothetical protein [Geoalkalibacter subterraneus]
MTREDVKRRGYSVEGNCYEAAIRFFETEGRNLPGAVLVHGEVSRSEIASPGEGPTTGNYY